MGDASARPAGRQRDHFLLFKDIYEYFFFFLSFFGQSASHCSLEETIPNLLLLLLVAEVFCSLVKKRVYGSCGTRSVTLYVVLQYASFHILKGL